VRVTAKLHDEAVPVVDEVLVVVDTLPLVEAVVLDPEVDAWHVLQAVVALIEIAVSTCWGLVK